MHRDEEMDGEWEAPQIPNPACETAPGCGVWKRPMINNPDHKGKWKAPLVDNPNYQVVMRGMKMWTPPVFVKQQTRVDVLHVLCLLLRESGSPVRSITPTILRTCSRSG